MPNHYDDGEYKGNEHSADIFKAPEKKKKKTPGEKLQESGDFLQDPEEEDLSIQQNYVDLTVPNAGEEGETFDAWPNVKQGVNQNILQEGGKWAMVGLTKFGEGVDWVGDHILGIPGTDIDLYHARKKLIDPLNEQHLALGLLGEILLPDALDVATLGLSYIPSKFWKFGREGLQAWAKVKRGGMGNDAVKLTKQQAAELFGYQVDEAGDVVQAFAHTGDFNRAADDIADEVLNKNPFFDPKDWEVPDSINKVNRDPGPILNKAGDVSTNLLADTKFTQRWGDSSELVAEKIEGAIHYARGNTGNWNLKGLRDDKFFDLDGVKFRIVRDHKPVDLVNGTGYTAIPELTVQQRRLLRVKREDITMIEIMRGVNKRMPEASKAERVEMGKAYKAYIDEGNNALSKVSQAWNKALGGEFMSVDHIVPLKEGGRNIPANKRLFPKRANSKKNAEQIFQEDVLHALGVRWNLEEDIAAFVDKDIGSFYASLLGTPAKQGAFLEWLAKGWDTNDAIYMVQTGAPPMNPGRFQSTMYRTMGKSSIPR